MRNSRFEDVSPFGRAMKAMTLVKSTDLYTSGLIEIFSLDGLFWRVSGLLSDLEAAVERRLLIV
ncbi:hypothetical protein [Beijerinckia sp. L45]|uniref:hypothetical protein n=1 Tax=Beijerinckia sp. L45 TaxID=1641855 RepID=UPI00131DA9DD|nr:hypothetical protein [Beijerinckia sp. L45]